MIVYVLTALAVVAVFFGGTLFILDDWNDLTQSDLQAAMKKSGYTLSDAIVANIDDARRDFQGRLSATGWAVDKELGQPVSIYVVLGQEFVLVATTKGARSDVTNALHLSAEQTKDVAFSGHTERPIDCKVLPHAPIVAVNRNKHLLKIVDGLRIPLCH